MTTDKKTPDSRIAAKPKRAPKDKATKRQGANKGASRQKAGIVEVIGAARKATTKSAPASKPAKTAKQNPVRDDFKMPAGDYALIESLKQRALQFNRPTKKNELLRAGLQALAALDDAQLQQRLLALEPAKLKEPFARNAKAKA